MKKTKASNLNPREIAPPTEDSFGFWGTIQSNSSTDEDPAGTIGPDAANRLWAVACQPWPTPSRRRIPR